jgi:aspartate/methionine/tyrosine aminotransferase
MQIEIADRLNGIGEYYFSQKLREIEQLNKTGEPVINLGIGSPDLPPHPGVIKTLQDESAKPNVHGYQNYKGVLPLRKAISDWYKKWYAVDLNADTEILPLIGSKEGIMHISMAYLNPGDIVLIPNPGYPTYRSAATIAGATIIEYHLTEENNWFPDFKEIEEKLTSSKSRASAQMASSIGGSWKGALMWVNYPHMPTGQAPTHKLFETLVAFGRKHNILICHDNPYSFILNEKPMSLLNVDGAKEVVVELNSLSKSHNMAGWRIGMLCGAKEKIEDVLRFKSNMDSGMFLPLQMAAAKALTLDENWHNELNTIYKKRREKVFQLLDELSCIYSKEQVGLFVWAKIPDTYSNGFELSDEILQKTKVFITPGGIFGNAGDKYIRVSLCSTEEKYEEAINRIAKISVQKT